MSVLFIYKLSDLLIQKRFAANWPLARHQGGHNGKKQVALSPSHIASTGSKAGVACSCHVLPGCREGKSGVVRGSVGSWDRTRLCREGIPGWKCGLNPGRVIPGAEAEKGDN